jgi:glycosyltransferase involved in cell wall biosynthesis
VTLLEACRAAAEPLGPFEICVTNDGSRDDTGAALELSRPPIRTCP